MKDKIKLFEFKENNNRTFASFELKEPLSTKKSIFLKGKINKEVYHLEIDNGDSTKSTIEIHLKNPLEKDLTLERKVHTMSSSYSNTKAIEFSKGDMMNKNIEIYNYDSNGNKVDPSLMVINIKVIYEIVKKYIKEQTS